MKITHLVFTDIETTAKEGPDANTDSIIEIAAARVELATRTVVPIVNTLIRPYGAQTIPYCLTCEVAHSCEFATPGCKAEGIGWDLGDFHKMGRHFHGVTQAQWNEAPELGSVLADLVHPFTGAAFAGQNPHFDIRYIQRDFAMCQIPFPKVDYHRIDTCSPALFLVMLGKVEGLSLRYSRKWAKCEDPAQGHRSWSDVLDAITVFFAMFDFFTKGIEPDDRDGPSVLKGLVLT